MFLLLKELSPPDGLPARTHPLGRGVFNETPSLANMHITKSLVISTLDYCNLKTKWALNSLLLIIIIN